jgi:hypothetical protein
MAEHQHVTGTQPQSRAVAGNASSQGISRTAVTPFSETREREEIPDKLPAANFGTKAQHSFPIQRKGGKLTFTELSIYSPGNSATFAEVTLDGQSLDKWNNKDEVDPDNETENKHAEHKIVDDLRGKYLNKLKAAKVLSLTINRAPCESCAQRLVKLKQDYNIEIRVKATIITEKGLGGLPVLAAAGIPFRIFTIAQREAIGNNKGKENRKRVWGRGNRYLTEGKRVEKTAEGNDRDLKTTSKDLSTDTGRTEEEQANLEKAQVHYPNAHLSWRAQGKSTAELAASRVGGGGTVNAGGTSGPQPYPNRPYIQQDDTESRGRSRFKPVYIDDSEEEEETEDKSVRGRTFIDLSKEEDVKGKGKEKARKEADSEEEEDEAPHPVRSRFFSSAPSSSGEKEEEEPPPLVRPRYLNRAPSSSREKEEKSPPLVRSKYFSSAPSSSGERQAEIPPYLRYSHAKRNLEKAKHEPKPQKTAPEPKRRKITLEPPRTAPAQDAFFSITMEEVEDDQGWIEHEVSEINALAAKFKHVTTEFSSDSVTFIVSASEHDDVADELQRNYSYRASITTDKV